MNTLYLTITGVRYAHPDYQQVLERLKGQKKTLNTIVETSTSFGKALVCYYEGGELGKVSRLDVPRALQLLDYFDFRVIPCTVCEVYPEQGYLTVSVEIEDEIPTDEPQPRYDWSEWEWSGPTMDTLKIERDALAMGQILQLSLTRPLVEDASDRAKQIRGIRCELAKFVHGMQYTMCWEMQQASLRIRNLMAAHADEQIRNLTPTLVRAINDLGSGSRVDEFQHEQWPMIRNSREADELLGRWMAENGVTNEVSETNYRTLKLWIEDTKPLLATKPVRNLPLEFGHEGQLFLQLVYRDIPMQKWLELRSFIIILHRVEEMIALYESRDTQNCSVAESEPIADEQAATPNADDEVVALVIPLMHGNRTWAAEYVAAARQCQSNMEVCELTNEYIDRGRLPVANSHRRLHSILHAHGIYTASEGNWNRYVKSR